MDESSNLSHLFPNVLTQDDSPQTINEVIDGGLTMRSVLDNFVLTGDMSPSVTAPFVTCAVDRMDKTEIQNKSPARKLLYRRHQLLDGDTTMTDSEKKINKNEISKAYIKTYTGKSRQPSMVSPQPTMNVPKINDPLNKRLIFESPKNQTYATMNMSSVTPNNLSQLVTIKKKKRGHEQNGRRFLFMNSSKLYMMLWLTLKINTHRFDMRVRGNIKFPLGK